MDGMLNVAADRSLQRHHLSFQPRLPGMGVAGLVDSPACRHNRLLVRKLNPILAALAMQDELEPGQFHKIKIAAAFVLVLHVQLAVGRYRQFSQSRQRLLLQGFRPLRVHRVLLLCCETGIELSVARVNLQHHGSRRSVAMPKHMQPERFGATAHFVARAREQASQHINESLIQADLLQFLWRGRMDGSQCWAVPE